jgi:nitronate monooxygenase
MTVGMLLAKMTKQSIRALKSTYPWTSTPLIVGAPMKSITGPPMAMAVSSAGGFGFIGPGDKPEDLESHLSKATELVTQSSAFSDTKNVLPIGIAVQTWTGDLGITRNILKASALGPAAAWLFAPRYGQTELDEWTRGIRDVSPQTKVWIQVSSVADAIAAARSKDRPDVLVVQGADAGGHSTTKGAGIVTLLPEVSDALSSIEGAANMPLIAAGGLTDSRGTSAAFVLGASGVALGTRFLATKEAQINPGYQKAVIDAWDGGQNTVRTQLYNHLRGTMGWPDAFDARGLVNQSWLDHERGLPFAENQSLYKEAMKKGADGWGSQGRMATYAGTGVGLIKEVKGAGDVVKELRNGISGVLGAAVESIRD